MKELQKAGPPEPQIPDPEEPRAPDLDDRIAAAAAAFVFGAPTAFLIWLLALAAGAFIHAQLPHLDAFLAIWAVLVMCGFAFPHSTDEMFGSLWVRLILGIEILAVVVYVTLRLRVGL